MRASLPSNANDGRSLFKPASVEYEYEYDLDC
jgi:hypothetical protein